MPVTLQQEPALAGRRRRHRGRESAGRPARARGARGRPRARLRCARTRCAPARERRTAPGRAVAGCCRARAQDRLLERRRWHTDLARERRQAARRKHVLAVAPVVGEVGVGDAGRGRDEVRPRRELLCYLLVEQDVGLLLGLVGQREGGLFELVAKTLALPVDQHRARLEQRGRGRQRGGHEAHHEGAQDRRRHVVERPGHEAAEQRPGRQPPHETVVLRRDEADLGAKRQVAVDDASTKLKRHFLAVTGRGRIYPFDLAGLLRDEAPLKLSAAREVAGGEHHTAPGEDASRTVGLDPDHPAAVLEFSQLAAVPQRISTPIRRACRSR